MAKKTREILISKVVLDGEKEAYCSQIPGGNGSDSELLRSLPVRERTEAMIHWLLLNTGVRVSELCGLKMKGTPSYLGTDFIEVLGKGGVTRNVPVSSFFRRYIDLYINDVRPHTMPKRYGKKSKEGWLLYDRNKKKFRRWQIAYLVRITAEQAGIVKTVTPHSFRHRVASKLLMENGSNIFFVKSVLGHSSISTTEKYLHLAEMFKCDVGLMMDQMQGAENKRVTQLSAG